MQHKIHSRRDKGNYSSADERINQGTTRDSGGRHALVRSKRQLEWLDKEVPGGTYKIEMGGHSARSPFRVLARYK